MSNVQQLHPFSIFGICTVTATNEEYTFDGNNVTINLPGDDNASQPITVAHLDYLSVNTLNWDNLDLDPEDCSFFISYNNTMFMGDTLADIKDSY